MERTKVKKKMRRKPTRYHSRANIYYDIGRKAVAEEAFPEQGK